MQIMRFDDQANGGPIRIWSGDEETASLLDFMPGYVVGHYWHDGYGKWDAFVCLPLLQAWRASRSDCGIGILGVARFPRFWVPLRTVRCAEHAIAQIEQLCGEAVIRAEWMRDEELEKD